MQHRPPVPLLTQWPCVKVPLLSPPVGTAGLYVWHANALDSILSISRSGPRLFKRNVLSTVNKR